MLIFSRIYGQFDFRAPQYVVRDPKLFKQIYVKDFDHFEDHFVFFHESIDRLWGNALFSTEGEKWRQMRATLSPAFTGSKMRQMFELITECTDDVMKHFLNKIDNGEPVNVEMKDFFTRYTNDVIATCAFGLKINSFANRKNEFYLNGLKLLDLTPYEAMLRFFIIEKFPFIARLFNVTFSSGRVSNLFRSTILETMDTRTKDNIYRPDMINMLMQIRKGTLEHQTNEQLRENEGFASVQESEVGKMSVNRRWNDDEIVGMCFNFFAAGFDTSSKILTFSAFEIATNPHVQQKLYEEIVETDQQLCGGRITYDALQKMKYLDQVICETLRMWPPDTVNDRVCTKDYVFDDGDKLKFQVERGAVFVFPIYSIHRHPEYFPQPNKFDPERFSDENKQNIRPETYLPFGIGPRNCIGSRFALMEIKTILYHLLLNFTLEPNDKTQIPVEITKSGFMLDIKDGVHLELRPRIK